MPSIVHALQTRQGTSTDGRSTLVTAAHEIGCEIAVLEAIIEVESNGRPFDDAGRLIILPEKHVFHRELPKTLRAKAVRAGLAAKSWKRANYEGLGGAGSDARWRRLERMAESHETAALRSTSYGGPQIMGFNHAVCGYPDVTSFVLAMAESVGKQHAAFIAFLRNSGLADDLREKDFRAIARRYNGPGQVARYARLMEDAYERLADDPAPARSRDRALRLGSSGYRVRALQERLVDLGYHVRPDGDFGPATRRAIVAFQTDHGLKADGIVGPATEAGLEAGMPIADQPGGTRDDMTVADLREQGSQTVKHADHITAVGGAAAAGGVAIETVNRIDAAEPGGVLGFLAEFGHLLRPVVGVVTDNAWLLVVLLGAAAVYAAWRIKQRRLHDAKSWRHVG